MVNSIDFNAFGYASGVSGSLSSTVDIATDNLRGITSIRNTDTTRLWREKTYTIQADMVVPTTDPTSITKLIADNDLYPGLFINSGATGSRKGGRIKSINAANGKIVISTASDLASGLTGVTEVDIGTSGTGDVFGQSFVPNGSLKLAIDDVPGQTAGTLAVANRTGTAPNEVCGVEEVISDLAVTGFNSLPKRKNTSLPMAASMSPAGLTRVAGTPVTLKHADRDGTDLDSSTPAASQWVISTDIAPSFSENLIFPPALLERMSSFKDASVSGTGVLGAADSVSVADYKDGDSALLDILYNAQPSNMEKVFESMLVAIDDVEVRRDSCLLYTSDAADEP